MSQVPSGFSLPPIAVQTIEIGAKPGQVVKYSRGADSRRYLDEICRYGKFRSDMPAYTGYNIDWDSPPIGELVTARGDGCGGNSIGVVTDVDDEDVHIRWDHVSKEVPFPPRKLKMKWSSEAGEDLHAFTGIDVNAQVDQIKEEEDENIFRKIARRVGLKR